jgi:hypothetical protein
MRSHKLLFLAILGFILLSCAFVQSWAEPFGRQVCKADCNPCDFSRYIYQTNSCFCVCDGHKVQLY